MCKTRKVWLKGELGSSQNRLFAEALDAVLWEPGSEDNWDAIWHTSMPAAELFADAPAGGWVNHIPGNNHLTVKSALHKTVNVAMARWETNAPFLPETYNLPAESALLRRAAAQSPDQAWVLKPANGARGEGIRLLDTLDDLPATGDWVVQRYLDSPHLYHGRKYVLRLYVLISAVDPLRIWRFTEGSVKLASLPYNPEERENPYVFLTNPDVNERNAEVGVEFLSLADYSAWLRAQGHESAILFDQIDDLIVQTVMAGCEAMRARTASVAASSGCAYELIGLDCLVDTQLKPWLLECNLSPSLDVCARADQGGVAEAAMKKALIDDLVGLLGFNEPDLPSACPLQRQADEMARSGRYRCLYPSADAVAQFHQLIAPSLRDQQAMERVSGKLVTPSYEPWRVTESIENNQLFLTSQNTGERYVPNDTASWIWLQMSAGAGPEEVAAQVATEATLPRVRAEVWQTLQSWSRQGLIRQKMTI